MNVTAAYFSLKNIFLFAALCFILFSCSVVRNPPANKPFVYETNIELQGKLSTDDRKELITNLEEQLHDSIRVRRVQKLIGWKKGPRFFYSELPNPPVYDSLNADKSVIYMRALLNSLGYYRDTIVYDTSLHVAGNQYRTTVNFQVDPGKLIRIDSISYNLGHDTLQQITINAQKESLIKKGEPFAKPLISTEFDRLTDVYRNNGFLRFSREELLAIWDTVGIALLTPTIDPIEQAQQLEALRQRRENPTADIEVRLRANNDTSHLIRYHVGNITIYPDLTTDTSLYIPIAEQYGAYQIITYRNLYKPKILAENIYLQRGDLYSQRNYLKTLNRFNSLGSWRLVNIEQVPRGATDTVDFVIKLTPAKKYTFDANLEGSQNWGNVFTEGNLIGVNIGLQNRNFARGANIANTNFRFGTEILQRIADQTRQISFGHTINFPRIIPGVNWVPARIRENFKTVFALNANYTTRPNFFNLLTLNTSWGYEFNWKNKLFGIRAPNIEYAVLDVGRDLQKLIDANQSYRYIFNSGLVSSVITNFTVTGGKKSIANVARFNVEASGILLGLVRSNFLDSNLHRFLKFDGEFRQTHKIRRSAFAWRFFSGVGYELQSGDPNKKYLPFFKAYYAGGANSMRAWPLRKLGPGSAIRSYARTVAPDRFGDIQIELNGEYRFYITEIGGFDINSALFTDIGNIWYLRRNPDFLNGEFRLNKLWKDLAVGAGTGVRLDFGLFLVRLDYAYKVKDPSPGSENPELQNKLFPDWKLTGGQFQLGVTYPF
ncbi:MAG: BamA/TamA family outer membrane protein [Chitinophagaceae bacterium]